MGGSDSEQARRALALFKQFLAERWFGGPDFDSWVGEHREFEAALRELRDQWLAGLADPTRPALLPAFDTAIPSAGSFAAGQIIAGYRLKRRLGVGASGEVWLAEELALGNREVALKLLRPDLVLDERALERFKNEAFAGAYIHHPGVVTVLAMGRFLGQPYIAMEYVEGRTLAAWIAAQRDEEEVSPELYRKAVALALQVAEALQAAHAEGILHRDVKPANILIARDGRAKVADFGLARVRAEGGVSHTGDVMGTFSYMSPEQMRGEVNALDGRTDVFALGATFYEMLTGKRAFAGKNYEEIMRSVLFEEPLSLRKVRAGVPRDLELVCLRALEKRASERYPSMAALAEDLRRFLAGEPPLARSTVLRVRVAKWIRRHRLLGTSSLLALASAAIVLGFRTNSKAAERGHLLENLHLRQRMAIEFGDLAQAEVLARDASEIDADDPNAQLILAGGYAQYGRMPEAEALLEGVGVDLQGAAESALEHEARALFLQSRHDFSLYPEAEQHLRRALELDPTRYGLLYSIYQLRSALYDDEGARAALTELRDRLRPSDPFQAIVTATLQEKAGDPATALATLEELRARLGNDPRRLAELRWHRHAGRILLALGQGARAEELLRIAVEHAPADCWSLEALAVLYFERIQGGADTPENRAAMFDYAQRAEACSPSLWNPHLMRAWVAVVDYAGERPAASAARSENRAIAERELAFLADAPEEVAGPARRVESFLLCVEARPLFEGGDYAAALPLLSRAVELDPSNLEAASEAGISAWQTGGFAQGLALTEATCELAEHGAPWSGKAFDALLVWRLGNAAWSGDEAAFQRAREHLVAELDRRPGMDRAELRNAAEFAAIAPGGPHDCELAWRILEMPGIREGFLERQPETLAQIEQACE